MLPVRSTRYWLVITFLVALLASSAWGATSPTTLFEQRLGLTRMSLQRLHPGDGDLPIDLGGQRVTLRLERSTIRSQGFRVLAQRPDGSLAEVAAPAAQTYRGRVLESPGSIAGGSIRGGMLRMAIALRDGRVFYVQPIADADAGADPALHAVYDALDAIPTEGGCATNEPAQIVTPPPAGVAPEAVAQVRAAEIAFDSDYEFFVQNGGTIDATVSDIENILIAVNVVYQRDCELTHRLTTLIVRPTEPDPYSALDANSLLDEFENYWNANQTGVVRDIAHLMTGKVISGSTIGIAALGAICSRTRGYGLSRSRFTTNLVNRTALTAHELGHNWNAHHCDGASPCLIMCSTINGCHGVGMPNFEPTGITAIKNFALTRTCLDYPTAAVAAPKAAGTIQLAAPNPSPFASETRLDFFLEREAAVQLGVYDAAGHRVARLADETRSPGWHTMVWNGTDQRARRLPPGVFYARLEAAGERRSQKIVLLK